MRRNVTVRKLALAAVSGALAMQAALALAAPPTSPGGGATNCEDTYKSCKSHCKNYGYQTGLHQTCMDTCKKDYDKCKAPASGSPK